MGFNIGWIATQDKSKDAVLSTLRMRDTGVRDDGFYEPFSGADMPAGWYTVIDAQTALVDNYSVLEPLSTGARTLSVAMLEGSMLSYAAEWLDGRMQWCVTHDASSNPVEHLDVWGSPPREFAGIRDRLLARQRGETRVDHVFEIPLELAVTVLPFRPDRVPLLSGLKFTVLKPA